MPRKVSTFADSGGEILNNKTVNLIDANVVCVRVDLLREYVWKILLFPINTILKLPLVFLSDG